MRIAAASDEAIAARVKHFLYRVPEELYDYSRDPDALGNLVDDAKYAKEVAQYRRQLLGHLKATGDPLHADFEKFLSKKKQRRAERSEE